MNGLIVIASIVLLAGCASMERSSRATATADLRDRGGQEVGSARLDEVDGGVHIVVELKNMPPGDHAVHIHTVGKCDPPEFTTAGGHFNPDKRQHGTLNPQGPHAGDLPNVTVGSDGTGRLETTTDRVALGRGPTSLFDADGSALVIHVTADDFKTDPAGNAGARIVCGVIVKQEASQPESVRGRY